MPCYLGFDPGTVKCGLAAVRAGQVLVRAVVPMAEALPWVTQAVREFGMAGLVLGNQTGSRSWQVRLQTEFPELPIHLVDERYSSQEARLRYWDFYPARWQGWLPRSLRVVPTPYDDVVAVVLVERFLAQSTLSSV
ncbi:resolvase [Candidatus Cyanaurora vandensis]|uniref:resolvase n=1 Tax=Candidatus Cyanaurora vandensis TaxID=2714958 RepID=UPI00257AE2F5|nr:resolvase [Candidatus Cyanaurora vandensis]